MTSEITTAPAPAPVRDLAEGTPHGGPTAPRPDRLTRRRDRRARRRSLALAIAVCAGVPLVLVVSLWRNLNEAFWYNEQWRAYYVSDPGNWWSALKGDGAPFPAGWFFLERASSTLFGSTELTLRLPTALFLPLGCVLFLLLARRWMPIWAAVVVALLGSLTGTLVSYAVQLSEYQIDAAAVLAVVLLHELAGDVKPPAWRSYRVYAAYAGIAVACVFSTPVVFIAGPILLLDALRALRARTLTAHTLGAVGAGIVALAHLGLFVLPQSALRSSPYWDDQFLPHHGLSSQLAFVWDGLRGFVTGALTSSGQAALPGQLLGGSGSAWLRVFTVIFVGLLVVGAVQLAHSLRGRTILFALVGSQVVTLVASYWRYWPFGFTRTNYSVLPLLFFVAAVGAVRSWSWAFLRVRVEAVEATPRRIRPTRAAVLAGTLVLIAAAVFVAATYEVGGYRQIRDSTSAQAYGDRIDRAVATVRTHADPGAAVVVAGAMAVQGWSYYQYEYSGSSTQVGHQIPPSRVALIVHHGSPSISRMVDRERPQQVFVYIPFGTSGAELGRDTAALASGGRSCQTVRSTGFSGSGLLVTLSCSRR